MRVTEKAPIFCEARDVFLSCSLEGKGSRNPLFTLPVFGLGVACTTQTVGQISVCVYLRVCSHNEVGSGEKKLFLSRHATHQLDYSPSHPQREGEKSVKESVRRCPFRLSGCHSE